MKQITSIFFFLLFLTACNAQTKNTDYSKAIVEQAEMMGELLVKKDFDSFCKYTYPKIVEMMGGKQKMIEVLENGVKEMQKEGTAFLNVSFGVPSDVITTENELQCTIPQTIEMKVPDGRLVSQSTLVAISTDKGINWYFVDTSGKDIETMKKTLPNLSAELVIPKKTKPVLYAE